MDKLHHGGDLGEGVVDGDSGGTIIKVENLPQIQHACHHSSPCPASEELRGTGYEATFAGAAAHRCPLGPGALASQSEWLHTIITSPTSTIADANSIDAPIRKRVDTPCVRPHSQRTHPPAETDCGIPQWHPTHSCNPPCDGRGQGPRWSPSRDDTPARWPPRCGPQTCCHG